MSLQNEMVVYLDFDGTISDCRERMYRVFCHIIGENLFTFDEYWKIKRFGVTQRELLREYLGYSDDKIDNFSRLWIEDIEKQEWINYDKPVEGIYILLEKIKETGADIVLVTNRQKRDILINQLKKYEICTYFEAVLVTEQKKEKFELINEYERYGHTYAKKYYLADMKEDVITAKKIGAEFYLVVNEACMVEVEYTQRILWNGCAWKLNDENA